MPALQETLEIEADDIDLALSKAARHLDDSADRLDQIASELHLDNPPDNPLTSHDAVDNSVDDSQMSDSDDTALTPEKAVADVQALVRGNGSQENLDSLLNSLVRSLTVPQALQVAFMLRNVHLDDQAMEVLGHAVSLTAPADLPPLTSVLRDQQQDAELYQLLSQTARSWPASAISDAVACLRDAGQDVDAYQVLSAAGRDCPPVELLKVLARANEHDARWILDAACRDRSLDGLPPLAEALRNLRRADAEAIDRAHRQREEDAVRGSALVPRPRPQRLLTSSGEEETSEARDENLVRPYAMAGGDAVRPRYVLPLDTPVRTTANASQLRGLLPEHQRICQLCREPHTVSEVAEQLSIPVGVARILIADLSEAGLLALTPQPVVAAAQLDKGGSIELAPETSRTTLTIGLGWEATDGNGSDFDLDASAIGTKGGRVYSDQYFVFFNNLSAPDNSIVHTGNNAGIDGDQETILVNLAALPTDLDIVIFAVSIYDADDRGQNFSQVRNAYIRITTPGGHEIACYDFSGETTETAMIFGELYRFRGKWKFRAVGQGYASGLLGIALDFGVNV
jgi:tellurium resistance protein TerD